MAVELRSYLTDVLAQLPEDHPDRDYLMGLKAATDAFVERTDPAFSTVAWDERRPAPEHAVQPPLTASTDEQPPAPEQERVHLRGRAGSPPTFRTTPKGVLVGSFPLAVREETAPDRTTWWKVFVFRQRAEKLRAQQLAKGASVEVIGYGYDHTLTKRDGTTTTEHRVNAVAVKLR